MSSQRGNVKKNRPQKHQNKSAWKNVYHDTSVQTKKIVNTEVSGVCKRCKDVIDWKIKYKKYKPLTQPKTCAKCKEKTVRQAYYIYCHKCSKDNDICSKCGEKKEIVLEPSLSEAEQASQERQLQAQLECLPERKRRTFLRLQAQGNLTPEAMAKLRLDGDDDDFDFFGDDDDDDESEEDELNDKIGQCSVTNSSSSSEETKDTLNSSGD